MGPHCQLPFSLALNHSPRFFQRYRSLHSPISDFNDFLAFFQRVLAFFPLTSHHSFFSYHPLDSFYLVLVFLSVYPSVCLSVRPSVDLSFFVSFFRSLLFSLSLVT